MNEFKIKDAEYPRHSVRVGVFSNIRDADVVVGRLHTAGFRNDQITVVCPTCISQDAGDHQDRSPPGDGTPMAAVGGGAIGAVLGGLAAVAGIAVGGGGVLVAGAMVQAAGGGAVLGGFIGAMLTRGNENEVTDFYGQSLQDGKVLVSVDASGDDEPRDLATAERIIRDGGAEPMELHNG